MKENYCVNCKYHKVLGCYTEDDYCLNLNVGDVVRNDVTGSIEPQARQECRTVRREICQGRWFEPKKSFMDKLVCLFKGE